MDFMTALWLPIVLSAVAVWIASAVGWMVIGHHSKDMQGMPGEEAFTAALRSMNVLPGVYVFPHAEDCKKAMKDPEFQARWKAGPTGFVSLWRSDVSMGKCMLLTFLVYLVVSVLVAYLGWSALPHADAGFARVFQTLGTAGVLAYAFSFIPGNIWFQAPTRSTVLCILDGVIYGLITGAVFAALWPAAQQ